jgi:CDP-glucose 4,6-dehydratase
MLLAEKLFNSEKEYAEAWNFGPEDDDAKPVGWILDEIKSLWTAGNVNWEIAEGDHPHETNLLKLDSTKAKTRLGWKPGLNLTQALGLTVEWYQAFQNRADLKEVTGKQIVGFKNI